MILLNLISNISTKVNSRPSTEYIRRKMWKNTAKLYAIVDFYVSFPHILFGLMCNVKHEILNTQNMLKQ